MSQKNTKTTKTATDNRPFGFVDILASLDAESKRVERALEAFQELESYLLDRQKELNVVLNATKHSPVACASDEDDILGENDDPDVFDILCRDSRYEVSRDDFNVVLRDIGRECDSGIPYTLTFSCDKVSDGIKIFAKESYGLWVSLNKEETQKAFDEILSRVSVKSFKLRERKATPAGCRGCTEKCISKCPPKPSAQIKFEPNKPVLLSQLKPFLLEASAYALPAGRMELFATKVNKKSQVYEYEAVFYPKSVKSYKKGETKQGVKVPFRIRMKGDDPARVITRFDKAISGLKFPKK